MKEFAFDVKLFAVVRIKAQNEKEARRKLAYFEDEFDLFANLTDSTSEVVLTSASFDDNGAENAELFEIDGESV